MKDGDFVKVINSDNQYYGKKGTVMSLRSNKGAIYVNVFLIKEKKQIEFFRKHLKTLQRK